MKELWMLDMGLGPCHGNFETILKDEYEDLMMESDNEDNVVVEVIYDDDSKKTRDEDENDGGQDVQIVLADANQREMGHRGD